MRKRLVYGLGVVLLGILLTLVVWQVSLNRPVLAATSPSQVVIFWGISTLIFVLTVTLGFILFRTGIKIYIDRRRNKEGSRIRSKLFFGALALSVMPVCFLVAYSYALLNRSLDKWFGGPADSVKLNYVAIANTLQDQIRERLNIQASLLAARPEVRQLLEGGAAPPGFLNRFCKDQGLSGVEIRIDPPGRVVDRCGDPKSLQPAGGIVLLHYPLGKAESGTASIVLAGSIPLNIAATQHQIASYVKRIDEQNAQKKYYRASYILILSLIALFELFVTTWIALFLARQITTPVSALLRAADEVGEGNFGYRVQVGAIDELAGLVRAFNEMTRQLESSRSELDARRRFTEAILESIPTGVISVSADGSIQRVNRALWNIFPEPLVTRARRLEDLFSREDTAEIKYLMKRARRTSAASREMELKSERQTRHLAVTVSALEEKITSGFVIVLEDMSDLLRAQKAAAWHEVARRVAHEIKNPLTPIALSAERIGRQVERLALPLEPQRIIRECTATISKEVESVKTLVNEFAQFARFPAAQPVRSDLNRVVEDAVGVFAGRLDGIDIRMQLAPDLPPVNIDREQFKRVVVNLVDNAAEAMQEALVKQLHITTQNVSPDTVEMIIADTGCGISTEDKERLFLPYFSTKGRGTGLGLAIVNHILSDHNATIRVEDNRPAGARFIVEVRGLLDLVDEPRAEAVLPHPVAPL